MAISPWQRRILRALGDTFVPSTGADDPAGGDVVPTGVEELLGAMEPADVKRVGDLLTMFELAALPLHGRPFSRLDEERRRRYVAGWMTSRIPLRRIIYRAIRGLVMNAYYQDPRAWPALHYDGPLVRAQRRAGQAVHEGRVGPGAP
jgi:hypothetical protein